MEASGFVAARVAVQARGEGAPSAAACLSSESAREGLGRSWANPGAIFGLNHTPVQFRIAYYVGNVGLHSFDS